jgi:hypothetical protein
MTDDFDSMRHDFEKYISYARRCLSLERAEDGYKDPETNKLWLTYKEISVKIEN